MQLLALLPNPIMRSRLAKYLTHQLDVQVNAAASLTELIVDWSHGGLLLVDTAEIDLSVLSNYSRSLYVLALVDNCEHTIVNAYKSGVDCCIAKPFQYEQVAERVEYFLDRSGSGDKELQPLEIGYLIINPASRKVSYKGELVNLTSVEFDILYWLAVQDGKVFKPDEVVNLYTTANPTYLTNTPAVHIGKIRRKIEYDIIKTFRGVGYSFDSKFLTQEFDGHQKSFPDKAFSNSDNFICGDDGADLEPNFAEPALYFRR